MSRTERPVVALLGVGTMGAGMARNIRATGLELRVWNRSPDKARPLAEVGATVADTAASAVADADVIVTMLYDQASVADVMRSAAAALAPGALWIQTSTVGVTGADALAELAGHLGIDYVDAPVLGTRTPAEDGSLVVLASGTAANLDRAQPIFDAIGSRTVRAGSVGAGSRLKLAANSWILALLEGMAESLKLAEGLGLEPAQLIEAVTGGPMDSPYLQLKSKAMLSGAFSPSFTVAGAAKDAELILVAGAAVGVDLPVTAAAQHYLQAAVAAGHPDADMAAIYLAH